MPKNLAGKVALITGAAHGQGRATAVALAREGVHIAALDVARQLPHPGYPLGTPEELTTTAEMVKLAGTRALPLVADVRDDTAVTAAVEQTIAAFGRIDILFNNAGICFYGMAHELSEAEWDAMLDINLKGAWMMARRV